MRVDVTCVMSDLQWQQSSNNLTFVSFPHSIAIFRLYTYDHLFLFYWDWLSWHDFIDLLYSCGNTTELADEVYSMCQMNVILHLSFAVISGHCRWDYLNFYDYFINIKIFKCKYHFKTKFLFWSLMISVAIHLDLLSGWVSAKSPLHKMQ